MLLTCCAWWRSYLPGDFGEWILKPVSRALYTRHIHTYLRCLFSTTGKLVIASCVLEFYLANACSFCCVSKRFSPPGCAILRVCLFEWLLNCFRFVILQRVSIKLGADHIRFQGGGLHNEHSQWIMEKGCWCIQLIGTDREPEFYSENYERKKI